MTAQITPPLHSSSRYRFQAYSSTVKIDLEQLRQTLITGHVERYHRDCLIVHRDDDQKIFAFRFGTAVFFNVPAAEHEFYLSKFGMGLHNGVPTLTREGMTEDDFTLNILSGTEKVTFTAVTLPELDLAKLQIIAQVLAQSSALELIEREVDQFLHESENMTNVFKTGAFSKSNRKRILSFLGASLSTRHRIVNQLSLLKEPEKTWEKEDLYLLYKAVFANFDIEDRIDKIESMFQLSSQVTELLLQIVNTRRAEKLELIIIALICVEIVKSFLDR